MLLPFDLKLVREDVVHVVFVVGRNQILQSVEAIVVGSLIQIGTQNQEQVTDYDLHGGVAFALKHLEVVHFYFKHAYCAGF